MAQSISLQPHFMCVELKVTVLVWRCKLLGLGNYGRVLFSKHPIRRQSILRSGRCSLAVGENSKQVGLLEICSSRMDTDLPG